MDKQELFCVEALHRLQEWCFALLGIETTLLILLVVICVFGNRDQVVRSRDKGLWSIALIGLSIIVGFNLIGTIPWSTQKIHVLLSPSYDIYRFPNYIGIPIWLIAFSQHVLTLLGMIVGYIFLSSLTKPEARDH